MTGGSDLERSEGDGCEAWRALVNKCEPTGKASVVGKLAEILRTPFEGDLLDAITTFERNHHDLPSPEPRNDQRLFENRLCHCWNGQSSIKEYLLLSAGKCDSWSNFIREVEAFEHAKKTISAPTPMEIDACQTVCHNCGKYGHTAKECRSLSHGGAEKPQCPQCGKKHHGQCWTRSYTSSHRESPKGGWKSGRK